MKLNYKIFSHCYGTPPIGSFALESKRVSSFPSQILWQSCREQFAASLNNEDNIEGFFFCHPKNKELDVANFLNKFEKIVFENLTNKFQFSNFSRTSNSSVLWVQPSCFWLDCPLKKSLFTILFRSSINYCFYENNFDETLFSNEFKENLYLRQTKTAILRFMFGFTKYKGKQPQLLKGCTIIKHGWLEVFRNLDETAVRKFLKQPEKIKDSFLGVPSLWT